MKTVLGAATVALAIAAAPAFAQTPQGADKTAKTTTAAADQTFVKNVAMDGMAEVELAKLASEKASSDPVKQFAQRMVTDHQKANDELKSIAQNKNITLPTELGPKHKTLRAKLEKLSGEAFDRAYMNEMVTDHRKAVSTFRTESTSGKHPEVKQWAAKTLPTLEEHLKQAQDANRTVVGTAGKTNGAKK
jgi:putative membrane protein